MTSNATNSLAGLIAGHLNAPYGPVVQASTVEKMLRLGTIQGLSDDPEVDAFEIELLQTLFVECAPSLIGRACHQLDVDLENAQKIYEELLAGGHPAVLAWEDAVKDVLI